MGTMAIKIKIDGFRCYRCGYMWVPRGSGKPVVCPHCKNPYWDKPRIKLIKRTLF